MPLRTILFLVLLFAPHVAGRIAAQSRPDACESAAHPVTETGEIFQLGAVVHPNSGYFRISQQDARYLRARIEVKGVANCDWYLTVRDEKLRPIQTLSPEDFAKSTSRWTSRIPGSTASFDLQGCPTVSEEPKMLLQEYILMPKNVQRTYYSAQDPGNPMFKDLYDQSISLRGYGDFVGFMMSSWERESWTCSGVMVAPDLFLTNWHCGAPRASFPVEGYWNEQIVKDTMIDISWDGDELSREYYGLRLAAADSDLDFALVEVAPLNWSGRARPVTITRRTPQTNDPIVIIHHPAARTKQVSLDCTILSTSLKSWRGGIDGIDFGHRCDTEAGSSGAPVLNRDGQLIGLHHRGFDVDSKTCAQTDRINKAVRIDKILDFLSVNHPDLLRKLSIK